MPRAEEQVCKGVDDNCKWTSIHQRPFSGAEMLRAMIVKVSTSANCKKSKSKTVRVNIIE